MAWAVMSIDAGSTGEAAEIDAHLLAAMFSAGLAKLQTISKAQVGDKTMMV